MAASTDLPEGGVRGFDVDGVIGFVRRDRGRCSPFRVPAPIRAAAAAGRARPAARCPCHPTSFAVNGTLVSHQLPTPPRALPTLSVREADGGIEVLAPPP